MALSHLLLVSSTLLLLLHLGDDHLVWAEEVRMSEKEAQVFLDKYHQTYSEKGYHQMEALWSHVTNLTEENKKEMIEQTARLSAFTRDTWKQVQNIQWKTFKDGAIKRKFAKLFNIGPASLPDDKFKKLATLVADMESIYSTASICLQLETSIFEQRKCNLSLDPDLMNVMGRSREPEVLAEAWSAWRDASGKKMLKMYPEYVELMNEAAKLNGFVDAGEMWRAGFESESFMKDLEVVWEEIRPLYEHLHSYVRRQLIKQYGDGAIQEDGPIPAHLLGNMWSQTWGSIQDITVPFCTKPDVDATPKMQEKNMTQLEMFKISEEFFTSLGLMPMNDAFWNKSVIVKPQDRKMVCHASAEDFLNGKDFRIKMCTKVTMDDLITVHHEMGHIEYFMQYAHQPHPFRDGANPGFHEAIGDALALSVATPQHLKKIGLLDDLKLDKELEINYLFSVALQKVAVLPYAYLMDLWRWNLFKSGAIPEAMNQFWWKLRLDYQGVCPPTKRTAKDFDPGAKYHVAANVPYIRYFVSHVIQFQFHKALCEKAGHKGPLHTCDIYKSKEAGKAFAKMLREGSRLPWPDVLEILTGVRSMTAGPLLEYFAPLREWLEEQNKGQVVGWQSADPMSCPTQSSAFRFFEPFTS